jgi:hypothetical protein
LILYCFKTKEKSICLFEFLGDRLDSLVVHCSKSPETNRWPRLMQKALEDFASLPVCQLDLVALEGLQHLLGLPEFDVRGTVLEEGVLHLESVLGLSFAIVNGLKAQLAS